ncbi:MAG: DUF4242 domain-containing protein [Bdellovibrionaceae bacterium]|nr:DUF4242 domain-containing protein [Pseudobdellovibrionaceae bacterium]
MPKYIIERDLGGVANIPAAELKAMAQRSNAITKEMGHAVHWIESFVTGDKIYCVYVAESDALIQEHATKGKFPCTKVSKIQHVIDKSTAE